MGRIERKGKRDIVVKRKRGRRDRQTERERERCRGAQRDPPTRRAAVVLKN